MKRLFVTGLLALALLLTPFAASPAHAATVATGTISLTSSFVVGENLNVAVSAQNVDTVSHIYKVSAYYAPYVTTVACHPSVKVLPTQADTYAAGDIRNYTVDFAVPADGCNTSGQWVAYMRVQNEQGAIVATASQVFQTVR